MNYIGLCGTAGTGKGEASSLLVNFGYQPIVLSDFVREETIARGIQCSRKNFCKIGNELRQKYGSDYMAQRAIKNIQQGFRYAIDGIRNPAELVTLRLLPKFISIGIYADENVLMERITRRCRQDDQGVTEKRELLYEERGRNQPAHGLRVDDCLKMCDYIIDGNPPLEEFKLIFVNLIRKILSEKLTIL